MTEIFKPRENMIYNEFSFQWVSIDDNSRLICDGGPSVIWNNGKGWKFVDHFVGKHRLDGPAFSNDEWYIHGKCVTYEIYEFAEGNDIDLENLSDEDKVLIALKFG